MLALYFLTTALTLVQQILGEQHQSNGARLHQWIASLIPSGSTASPFPLLPQRLTVTNHRRLLSQQEEWIVFITGGNRTCGPCKPASLAWDAALPILAVSPNPPGVATLDCDKEVFLCTIWPVAPPQILHLISPRNEPRSLEKLEARIISMQNATPLHVARIHTQKAYELTAPYVGLWHPMRGLISRLAPKLGLSRQIIKFMMT